MAVTIKDVAKLAGVSPSTVSRVCNNNPTISKETRERVQKAIQELGDDFAHHPTAIDTTLDGARKRLGERKLWAIIEPRSNTMRMGSHKEGLAYSARLADEVIWSMEAASCLSRSCTRQMPEPVEPRFCLSTRSP